MESSMLIAGIIGLVIVVALGIFMSRLDSKMRNKNSSDQTADKDNESKK